MPANDYFTNRALLAGSNATVHTSNRLATSEPNDPRPIGNLQLSRTLWWNWTVPASVTAKVTTQGSSLYNTLAVFSGSELTNLTLVGATGQGSGSTLLQSPLPPYA
jgi:hypothetical protein